MGAIASWLWIGAPRVEIERKRADTAIATTAERERALVGLGRSFGDLEARKRELDTALGNANRNLDEAHQRIVDGNKKLESVTGEIRRNQSALLGIVGGIGPVIDGIQRDTDQKRKLDKGLRVAIDIVRKLQEIIGP